MNLRLALLPLLLTACTGDVPPPLAGARIGGSFTLTDQAGRVRTERDFAGRWRIMYFGYTYCPDICPVDVANLVAGWRAFAKIDAARAAKVVPVFVTVDPARDTQDVLTRFTRAFDPGLVGLRGTPEQTAAIASAYGVVYQRDKPNAEGGYLVDHSRTAYLMDPQGKPVMLLSQDAKPAVIAGELAKWVR